MAPFLQTVAEFVAERRLLDSSLAFLPQWAGAIAERGLVSEWVTNNLSLWMGGIILFKILLWDAAMAWMMYHLMEKENQMSGMGHAQVPQ